MTIKLLGFNNDTYKVDSLKNMARQKGGTFSTKFNITGFEQNMPQGRAFKRQWLQILIDRNDKTVYTGV